MLFGFLYLFIFAAPSADGGLEKSRKQMHALDYQPMYGILATLCLKHCEVSNQADVI